jgi:hypothetical protein
MPVGAFAERVQGRNGPVTEPKPSLTQVTAHANRFWHDTEPAALIMLHPSEPV